MMNEESLKNWEQDNIEILTSREMGEWLYRRDMNARPQGKCKDCDNCEDKALSYSIGWKAGFLLGGFRLTELRRWLASQGYSEGTVDDKINEFTRFVERIRGEEE